MPEYRLFYCPYHDFFAIDNGKYIFFITLQPEKRRQGNRRMLMTAKTEFATT